MPARLNKEGISVPINVHLSELDKAFITLNYPGKIAVKDEESNKMSLYKAMEVAGIADKSTTGEKIIKFVSQGDHPAARAEFIKYNRTIHDLHQRESSNHIY
jgi:hypothetical protein